MPRALVVFESMYGNTEEVARAVADGLGERLPTAVVPVAAAPTLLPDDVRLVVVGGPTHAFGLSRTATRREATERGGGSGAGAPLATGLREWLEVLDARRGVRGAAFDTHVGNRLHGSAARGIRRRLRRAGIVVPTGPCGFLVSGTRGPLLDGERERARRWGADLAAQLVASGAHA